MSDAGKPRSAPGSAVRIRETESRTAEPCAGCGEETAIGSGFYSDRRVEAMADGTRTFVCTSCIGRAAAGHRGERLTDEQVRNLVENGSMAAISWSRGL
jgi:hypothetical protein